MLRKSIENNDGKALGMVVIRYFTLLKLKGMKRRAGWNLQRAQSRGFLGGDDS